MQRFLCHLLIAIAAICALIVLVNSAAAQEDSAEEQAQFILSGMSDARDALNSGICSIRIQRDRKAPGLPNGTESSDFNARLILGSGRRYRMEWIYPRATAEANQFLHEPLPPDDSRTTLTGYLIRAADDRSIMWFEGNDTIDIILPGDDLLAWADYFDVRAIGFYGWIELAQGLEWEFLIDAFRKKPVSQVNALSDGQYELVWQLGGPNSEWIVTVDADQGYTPVKAVMRQRLSESEDWRIVQHFEADWEEKGSAWVPIRYRAANSQKPEVSEQIVEMTFTWEQVNEPVEEALFTEESLNADDKVAIVDARLETPVVLKSSQAPMPRDAAPEPEFGSTGLYFVAANVAVFAVLLIWFALRRIRR